MKITMIVGIVYIFFLTQWDVFVFQWNSSNLKELKNITYCALIVISDINGNLNVIFDCDVMANK